MPNCFPKKILPTYSLSNTTYKNILYLLPAADIVMKDTPVCTYTHVRACVWPIL